jgi:cytochrome b involved in lipid metabolism
LLEIGFFPIIEFMGEQKPIIKKEFLVLGLIVIAGLIGTLLFVPKNIKNNNTEEIQTPAANEVVSPTVETSSSPEVAQPKMYFMEEVKAHADAASCWTVVRGNVYDITSAVDTHKGGKDKILSMCSVDATSAFEKQHGGQEKAESWLDTLKIGILNQQS